jgi:spartin
LTPKESERLSTKIANYLIAGGAFIASGIKTGADKGMTAIKTHSSSVRTKSPRTEKPIVIDPRVQSSVHYLRQGTKIAVKVSGYLVDRVGELAVHLGKSIASSAQKTFPKGTASGSVVNGVIEVAGGGIAGFSTVWMSLEDASRVLAKGIANETVQVVDHKYGESAAAVTGDLLHSAGYSAATAMYVDSLGFKGIAKRTAKHAGIAILKDLGKQSSTDVAPTPPSTPTTQAQPQSPSTASKKQKK